MNVDKIPVSFTPSGGWTGEMPPPALAGCDAPLGDGTVDIRVPLRAVRVTIDGEIQADRQMLSDAQRIEQADDQVTIAAGGVVHNMRCDGTEEHRTTDVAEFDKQTRIVIVATFEDGVHVLRPVGMPIEVRQWSTRSQKSTRLTALVSASFPARRTARHRPVL